MKAVVVTIQIHFACGVLHIAGNTLKFTNFINQYGRNYHHGTREYEERLAIFQQRLAEVYAVNSLPNRLWSAGVNQLTDRSDHELQQLRGWRGVASSSTGKSSSHPPSAYGMMFLNQDAHGITLPEEFMNWTTLAASQNIRDQGACGSCWAIASATILEAHSQIYDSENTRTFSTQDMLACVPNPHSCGGNGGCEGATVELALDWVMHQGLSKEEQDPYKAVTGYCHQPIRRALFMSSRITSKTEDFAAPGIRYASQQSPSMAFGMQAWERLPENKYMPLMRAIVEHGPVAVSVSAEKWYLYSTGIFDGCDKDAVIDHAVTLIGYGTDKELNEKFWLIQNSWGPEWGEHGMIRLRRRDNDEVDQCGVDRQPEVGTGCKGGPKEVQVCGMCGILYDSVVPHFK